MRYFLNLLLFISSMTTSCYSSSLRFYFWVRNNERRYVVFFNDFNDLFFKYGRIGVVSTTCPLWPPMDLTSALHLNYTNFSMLFSLILFCILKFIFLFQPFNTNLWVVDSSFPHYVVCLFKLQVNVCLSNEGERIWFGDIGCIL